jgi:hypothetical protein
MKAYHLPMLVVGYLHLTGFFTGLLSAFFVNDIICLVMVPFALLASRRMGLKPLPYLLAVATSANIGSVATITGNCGYRKLRIAHGQVSFRMRIQARRADRVAGLYDLGTKLQNLLANGSRRRR